MTDHKVWYKNFKIYCCDDTQLFDVLKNNAFESYSGLYLYLLKDYHRREQNTLGSCSFLRYKIENFIE